MKIRLAKFHPFSFPGLLFAGEEDAGGGTTDEGTADKTSVGGTDDSGKEADPEGSDALGDKGKKALDAMKAKWKAAEDRERAATARAAELEAKAAGKEAEYAAAQESQKVKDAAIGVANTRILKAEVRAAAATKLADPADALKFLDLSKFEVGQDGEVDDDAIAAAIDKLIGKKPYLAVQDGKRFKSGADGGTRKESSKSLDEQIAEALKAGNIQLSIALKQQRASLASKS